MGYYTHYNLTWDPKSDETATQFAEWRDGTDYAAYCLDEDGASEDPSSQWDPMPDARALSASCPGVLFTLHAEGEEPGDIWNAYFRDGKCYKALAQIIVPEFDAEKLQ